MEELETEVEKEEAKEPEREPVEVTILDTELEKLQNDLQESQERYVRLLAESENARKRMLKERGELTKYEVEKVVVEFLRPLDQFAKALSFTDHMSDDVRNWARGFEMILGQFREVLLDLGITDFDSKGKRFDPHLHEAVETEETDAYPDGTILEEFVRGYRMGDRVIRPANVKVAKAPKVEAVEEEKVKQQEEQKQTGENNESQEKQ